MKFLNLRLGHLGIETVLNHTWFLNFTSSDFQLHAKFSRFSLKDINLINNFSLKEPGYCKTSPRKSWKSAKRRTYSSGTKWCCVEIYRYDLEPSSKPEGVGGLRAIYLQHFNGRLGGTKYSIGGSVRCYIAALIRRVPRFVVAVVAFENKDSIFCRDVTLFP